MHTDTSSILQFCILCNFGDAPKISFQYNGAPCQRVKLLSMSPDFCLPTFVQFDKKIAENIS